VKDKLERFLHDSVCDGTVRLAKARKAFRSWKAALGATASSALPQSVALVIGGGLPLSGTWPEGVEGLTDASEPFQRKQLAVSHLGDPECTPSSRERAKRERESVMLDDRVELEVAVHRSSVCFLEEFPDLVGASVGPFNPERPEFGLRVPASEIGVEVPGPISGGHPQNEILRLVHTGQP